MAIRAPMTGPSIIPMPLPPSLIRRRSTAAVIATEIGTAAANGTIIIVSMINGKASQTNSALRATIRPQSRVMTLTQTTPSRTSRLRRSSAAPSRYQPARAMEPIATTHVISPECHVVVTATANSRQNSACCTIVRARAACGVVGVVSTTPR